MRSAECAETDLCGGIIIRISAVERCAYSGNYQKCVKICLKKHINMHPLPDVAPVSHIAQGRIEKIAVLRRNAVLNRQPTVKIGHIILSAIGNRAGGSDFLTDFIRAEIARLIEKLRQI